MESNVLIPNFGELPQAPILPAAKWMEGGSPLMTPAEVGELLGMSKTQVYEAIHQHQLRR